MWPNPDIGITMNGNTLQLTFSFEDFLGINLKFALHLAGNVSIIIYTNIGILQLHAMLTYYTIDAPQQQSLPQLLQVYH